MNQVQMASLYRQHPFVESPVWKRSYLRCKKGGRLWGVFVFRGFTILKQRLIHLHIHIHISNNEYCVYE